MKASRMIREIQRFKRDKKIIKPLVCREYDSDEYCVGGLFMELVDSVPNAHFPAYGLLALALGRNLTIPMKEAVKAARTIIVNNDKEKFRAALICLYKTIRQYGDK